MTAIISAIADGVGSLFKYSFWSVVTIGGLGAGFLFLTKPEEKTFWSKVDQSIASQNNQNGSLKQRLMAWGVSTALEKTSTVNYDDYVVCKVANVTLVSGQKLKFWGVLQNWYLEN